jgi:hypothetical protein
MRTTAEGRTVAAGLPTGLTDVYRLLLFRNYGSELMVAGKAPHFTLPCVEIPRWERVAENLNAAVKLRYRISVVCLFTPEVSAATIHGGAPLYQAMEAREDENASPEETCWLPTDSFPSRSFADPQDFAAVTDALRQMGEFENGQVFGPFAKPGWIEDLFRWTEEQIDPYRLRLTGNFRQLNASAAFALVRLETNGPAVWFKAVGEPNLREFPISVALSRFFPGFVPIVIATHPVWHGWLATEFTGATLDTLTDSWAWELAAKTLEELQTASLGMSDQLLDAGCRDLRAPSLLAMVDPFMEVASQLMDQQPKTPPPILSRDELRTLKTHIKATLHELAELDIPDSLGHLDLNPGNVVCSADGCIFLDWAEGYVGPPFFAVEYLRAHLLRIRSANTNLSVQVLKTYEARWRRILPPRTVAAAMDLAPLLAVFAYAAGSESWRKPALLQEANVAAYLRSLTRRIHGEMQKLQDRRQLCRR